MSDIMVMDQMRKKFEALSEDELEEYFMKLRSRTRDKKTGAIKSERKSGKSKLEKMLDAMSPEQREAFFASVDKKGK